MFRTFMIRELARMIGGETRMDGRDLVRGISINSKITRPGDLFFCLKGEHTDGHLYAKEALKNGAVGLVVERSVERGPEIMVQDTLFALGQLGKAYLNFYAPKTIGITGTNGKTTVKNLASAMLAKKYQTMSTKKNYNSLIGLPLTILDLQGDEEYLVLEMGTSNPGEIKRLCEIAKPLIGVITNVGPGHLKGLGSVQGARKEKLALLDALPENGFGLVGDGVGEISRRNIVQLSLNMLDNITLSEHGTWFTYQGNDFFTPLLGLANVYNCLVALALTSRLGIEPDAQGAALAETKAEPGRLESIRQQRLLVINDTYNANPVSMKAAIDFVGQLKRRKIFILGDMRELGGESKHEHEKVGDYARKCGALILTYGDEAKHYHGKHFVDIDKLFADLKENVSGNEVILVKASRALRFETIVERITREF